MLQSGVPLGIINKLIKNGLIKSVQHPTKKHFRVADGILKD